MSELASVNKADLIKHLTSKTSKTRGEVFTQKLSVEQGEDARDATAKEMYENSSFFVGLIVSPSIVEQI